MKIQEPNSSTTNIETSTAQTQGSSTTPSIPPSIPPSTAEPPEVSLSRRGVKLPVQSEVDESSYDFVLLQEVFIDAANKHLPPVMAQCVNHIFFANGKPEKYVQLLQAALDAQIECMQSGKPTIEKQDLDRYRLALSELNCSQSIQQAIRTFAKDSMVIIEAAHSMFDAFKENTKFEFQSDDPAVAFCKGELSKSDLKVETVEEQFKSDFPRRMAVTAYQQGKSDPVFEIKKNASNRTVIVPESDSQSGALPMVEQALKAIDGFATSQGVALRLKDYATQTTGNALWSLFKDKVRSCVLLPQGVELRMQVNKFQDGCIKVEHYFFTEGFLTNLTSGQRSFTLKMNFPMQVKVGLTLPPDSEGAPDIERISILTTTLAGFTVSR